MSNNTFLKAGIRLNKIHERGLKPHYTHLTKEQKGLVKILETLQQIIKDMTSIERRDKHWRITDFGQDLLERYIKSVDKKFRYCERYSFALSEKEENALLMSCHNNRFYGGSF